MVTKNTSINQESVNKIQEREQALNGWIAASSVEGAINGYFSGIKVMAGETATITLTFQNDKLCLTNGLSIDLVEGDYLPTPGLISATIVAGKVILIKEQRS